MAAAARVSLPLTASRRLRCDHLAVWRRGPLGYSGRMKHRNGVIVGVSLVAILSSFTLACGGDDDDGGGDFADIQGTATAAAQQTATAGAQVSPTATPDPAIAFYSSATTLAAELGDLVNTLNDDMLGAAANQADPKWPQVLTTDADLVIAKAGELERLTRPAGLPADLTAKLDEAIAGLTKGAGLLKDAITNASPDLGLQSAQALDAGEVALDEARALLEAGPGA